VCGEPIVSTYFALGEQLLCPACCEQANAKPTGSRFGRLLKATFLGIGAGLLGALIWFVIRRVAHLEIGWWRSSWASWWARPCGLDREIEAGAAIRCSPC